MNSFPYEEPSQENYPQRTLIKAADPLLKVGMENKPYVIKQIHNIKLSISQYSATFNIKYGPCIQHTFALQIYTYIFHQNLVNVINSRPQEILEKKNNNSKIQPNLCSSSNFQATSQV